MRSGRSSCGGGTTGRDDRPPACSSCENFEARLCQSQVLHKSPSVQRNTFAAAMDSTSTMEAPMTELTAPLASTPTDRCPNCGTQMAPDQRYCINCGERRSGGGLRDALPRTQTAAPAAVAARQRARLSPSTSLTAGVATLLLAMGVGVLIGRSGDHGTRAAAPQVVTVSAGAAGTVAAGGATTGTTAASTADTSKSSSKKKRKSSSAKAKVTGASSI